MAGLGEVERFDVKRQLRNLQESCPDMRQNASHAATEEMEMTDELIRLVGEQNMQVSHDGAPIACPSRETDVFLLSTSAKMTMKDVISAIAELKALIATVK